MKLTVKEVERGEQGITIITRRQARGGYKALAVRIKGLVGTPLGKVYEVTCNTREELSAATKEVARWLSKMGYTTPMAQASRHRRKKV